MAAGVGSPSGRRGYGDHKQGAHPVAAVAKARSGDPRRGDGSALYEAMQQRIQPKPPGGGRRLWLEQGAGE